jgi:LacI family transcriptional regulator
MRVRLADVAREAQVSITTASRALGGFSDVSSLTQRLVEETARRLEYVPNISAQRLRRRRTDMVGLILPADKAGFGEPFFSEFLAGVGEEAAALDRHLLLAAHPPDSAAEHDIYLQVVRGGWVDGVILTRLRWRDERVRLLRERGFPFVAFGRTGKNEGFPSIDEDSVAGLSLLVDHLIGLGHRRIAFVAGPDDLTLTHHRRRGFTEAMSRHRLPVPSRMIAEGDLRRESGAEAMTFLIDQNPPPTAVVFCNDMMALGGMEAATTAGLIVGRDVSIGGFDGIAAGEHTTPGLTTLRQPIGEIGRLVCRALVGRIEGDTNPDHRVLLTPELVIRGSTGPAPVTRTRTVFRGTEKKKPTRGAI